MRVLQVHTRYRQAGGEDRVVDAEAELLRTAGHVVHQHRVANPDATVPAAAALVAAPWNVRASSRLRHVVRELQPDVVHVHNTWFALGPAVLRALHAERPVVMTLHNYRLLCLNGYLLRDGVPCQECVGHAPLPGIRYRCYRDSASQSAVAAATLQAHRVAGTFTGSVDVYCVLSEFGRQRFVDGGLPAERIVVKPNFVEDLGGRPHAPSRSDEVLVVGRLATEKGVDVLLAAWKAAPPDGLRLTVIGDGPQRGELTSAAPAAVTFTGWVDHDEVRDRLRNARALAFPSLWYEGQSLVLLEALEAGLPVLGSDLGSTGEIVRLLGPSWSCPAGDVAAWAAALDVLRDDDAVDRGGSTARAVYESAFAPAPALHNLIAAYRLAVSRRM